MDQNLMEWINNQSGQIAKLWPMGSQPQVGPTSGRDARRCSPPDPPGSRRPRPQAPAW